MSQDIQKFILHLVQPCLVMCVAYLWLFMARNVLYFIPFSLLMCYSMYRMTSKYRNPVSSTIAPNENCERMIVPVILPGCHMQRGVMTDHCDVTDKVFGAVFMDIVPVQKTATKEDT